MPMAIEKPDKYFHLQISRLALHAESKMIIFTKGQFFLSEIMAPGLLAFLQQVFLFFFILHKVGLFCFNNELAALK